MPVASGSSVPPCPALAAPVMRRTAPTAWLELSPSGLSRAIQPWSGIPLRLRAILVGRTALEVARDVGTVKEGLDAARLLERGVEREGDRRHEAERHLARDLAADEGGAAAQRLDDLGRVRAGERHDEGGGVLEVGADPHLGHGDVGALQDRVAEIVPAEDRGEGVAQLLADAQLPLAAAGPGMVVALGHRAD